MEEIKSATVPTRALKAALIVAAATGEPRRYLTGVHIESKAQTVFVVATNGVCLLASCHADPMAHDFEVIVPRVLIENLSPRGSVTVRVRGSVVDVAGVSAEAVSGKYPDWRAIVPAKPSGEAGIYQPQLMTLLDRAAKMLTPHSGQPSLVQNGKGAAVSILRDGLFLIMPMQHIEQAVPAWALPSQAQA